MFYVEEMYGTKYKIKPWSTRQEISYNLFVTDETPVSEIFELMINIEPKPKNFSDQDMIYILYQTYINSTGGDVALKHTCSSCGQVNETNVQIGDFLEYEKKENKIIDEEEGYSIIVSGNTVTVTDSDGYELNEESKEMYLEDMDLGLAQKIEKVKSSSVVTIYGEMECIMCHNIDYHNLSDMYQTDLSKTGIQSLYQLGHDFTYYGHMTLDDYYNMIPFERDIYFNIIEATREEEAKINS